MHFVLILTAALAFYAQAAPQSNNNFGLRNRGLKGIFLQDQSQTDNENQNQKNGVIARGFSLQSLLTGHRRPNDQSQQMQQNNRGNSGQCWDFMSNTYKDWAANIPATNQFLSQFYNGHFLGQNNFNIPVIPCFTSANYWDGNQPSHGHGPQHNHGHGPSHDHGHGHGPPHDHGHGHGPPHDHGHGHGPPHDHGHGPPHDHGHRPPHNHGHGPPHDHGHGRPHDHGHGHGPPHDHGHGHAPPYHNDGSERPPLPPRPPHRPHHETVYKLEICEESSKENVDPENVETTTIGGGSSVVNPHDSSSPIPVISTPVPIPKDETSPESVTQSTINSSVKTTTEFDWNNYFIGASSDNTGAVDSIDIRGGGITAV